MAFTAENKADAYLFFVLAFNAAPGTVYGGQIVQAYEAGMTTADIVAQYVTKEQFLKLYPATQTNAEFAASLVANVSSAQTSATVKSAAETDIVAALAAGWTKAQVITQILGNLSAKSVADAEWGATVAQLNNKIAVAKALTEGDKALSTTDVALLTGPLAGVTEDVDTVQKAINGAGPLADKLVALNNAEKAQADFFTAQKVVDSAAIATKFGDAGTAVEAALGQDGYSTIVGGKETITAATQANLVSNAKAQFALDVNVKTQDLASAKTAFLQANSSTATSAELDAYLKASDAAAAASKALAAANTARDEVIGKLETGGADVVVDANTGTATFDADGNGTASAPVALISVQSGALAVDPAFASTATAEQVTLAKDLLAKIIAAQTATTANNTATTAKDDAAAALGANPSSVDTANDNLKTAQEKAPALDEAVAKYQAAAAVSAQDASLTKAVADAKQALLDAGFNAPIKIDAQGTTLTGGADLLVVDAKSDKATLTGFVGADKIFAGKDYVLSTDVAKGDNAKLEVFFQANGVDTDVYIELKAFGSNTAGAADGNGDIVKVKLAGVAADKVALKDGFITVAA